MSAKKFLKAVKDAAEQQQRRDDSTQAPHADDESNWLVSYADMMTLLCGFFIMLFSMSKLDEPKYEKVKEAVSKQFGGDYKSPTADLAKYVTQLLQEAGIEKEAVVRSDTSGVSVAFESTVFFDTLSADVRPQGRAILDKLIATIAERQDMEHKTYKIAIEGHTDSRPVIGGSFPSNWELSGARAARVVRLFLEKGYKPDRLTAIGYADTHPEMPSRTPAGTWDETALAKNRRVVVRIMEPMTDSIPFPEAETQPGGSGAVAENAVSPAVPPPARIVAPVVSQQVNAPALGNPITSTGSVKIAPAAVAAPPVAVPITPTPVRIPASKNSH